MTVVKVSCTASLPISVARRRTEAQERERQGGHDFVDELSISRATRAEEMLQVFDG